MGTAPYRVRVRELMKTAQIPSNPLSTPLLHWLSKPLPPLPWQMHIISPGNAHTPLTYPSNKITPTTIPMHIPNLNHRTSLVPPILSHPLLTVTQPVVRTLSVHTMRRLLRMRNTTIHSQASRIMSMTILL